MTRPKGPSRRSLISAVGAGTLLTYAGAQPATAFAAPVPQPGTDPVEVATGPSRTAVTVAAHDPAVYTRAAVGKLTVTPVSGTPGRTEVGSADGPLAVLTHGSRTVVLTGPERTFREDKRTVDDTFRRTVAPGGWGLSPGGGAWETANGTAGDYEVVPGAGVVRVPANSSVSRHVTLKDDQVADLDAVITGRFEQDPADAARSFALTFGYQGPADHCRARLSFAAGGAVTLHLEQAVSATSVTQLTTPVAVSPDLPAGSSWCIRVNRTGGRIQARAWRADLAEGTNWQITVDGRPPAPGRIGIRAAADSTALAAELRIPRVRILTATWTAPVTVVHRSWVRVLPEPYDGVWTPGVEQHLRGWLGSTAPDALAYGFHFLPGAPRVTSYRSGPPEHEAPVLGESDYGPARTGGGREEGADFHEYMGVNWTFARVPTGSLTKTAAPRFLGALDCSGYIRMVYGYHLGVPLAHESDHTSPGLLPRTAADMAARAPGTRIAHSATATPPPLTALQIGDLVFFDAESDPVDEIDHVGIYLGRDTADIPRFLSSRKTPNGATAADLGGPSTLTGTGTYATKLRTVHRL
ncbi:NlpC/P60 family protein [Streptomyces qinzhouensis]|uniref:NlpC/P60 family protein n=1 Tax=Streptomyces qinzhouensis TaxID=2599401 RepID=A0A5B8IPF9_9ACTN|nr:NlpC/P60 family protein [Streptomyces qinzhouensis]QDY80462.1 NlpC/P60 family protein [Streptomyces qinzhouensis]